MAILDLLFLASVGALLFLSLFGQSNSAFLRPRIVLASWLLLLLGLAVNDIKWQLFPAYIALVFQSLGLLKKTDTKFAWRIIGAMPLAVLVLVSIYLSIEFPLVKLPAPSGQYAVGTLDYSIVDFTRAERFEPARNRELYVEVWYPVLELDTAEYRKESLWHELYAGQFDLVTLLTRYLSRVETHSHAGAPIAPEGRFPLLVFNHGLYMFSSQNTQLMEHLASHGYVILSIAHPYESLKVNLEDAGSVPLSLGQAPDIPLEPGLPAPGFESGLESLVGTPVSRRYASLHNILDEFRKYTSETDRRNYVADVIASRSIYNLPRDWQEEYLYNYLIVELSVSERNVASWVEDIDFVLDEIYQLEKFSSGFTDSIDVDSIGILGMSFGGAAAGEFCKTDSRCKAGANMDGFQFGKNWRSPLLSPFLYVYSSEFAGNSDWAYLASADRMEIFSIEKSNHIDLTELVYSLPVFATLGISGGIPSDAAIETLNALLLGFFNQHLKDGPAIEGIESQNMYLTRRQLHQ